MRDTCRRFRGLGLFVATVVVALGPVSVVAQELAPEPNLDPLVAEVVAMLEGGVPAEIVLEWLDGTARRPGELSGEDLIALNGAGADEVMLRRFLALAGEGAPEATSPDPTAASPPEDSDSLAGTAPSAPSEPRGVPPEPPRVMHSPVDVFFSVAYKPKWKKDETPADLFVYLDGDFLARVSPSDDRALVFLRQLETGWHRLVVSQERHVRLAGVTATWTHSSRVSPVPIDFILPAEKNIEVQVVFAQYLRQKKQKGPLNLKILQGLKQLARQDQVGVPPSQWMPFCEDAAGAACTVWQDLWGEYGNSDLEAVRLDLAKFDFNPPPLP